MELSGRNVQGGWLAHVDLASSMGAAPATGLALAATTTEQCMNRLDLLSALPETGLRIPNSHASTTRLAHARHCNRPDR